MKRCPHCQRYMVASTPARDDRSLDFHIVPLTDEEKQKILSIFERTFGDVFGDVVHVDTNPPPSGWRDRDKLT